MQWKLFDMSEEIAESAALGAGILGSKAFFGKAAPLLGRRFAPMSREMALVSVLVSQFA
jgi:hypothetical protein